VERELRLLHVLDGENIGKETTKGREGRQGGATGGRGKKEDSKNVVLVSSCHREGKEDV